MREIKLKSLILVNFKGVRNLEVVFTDQRTIISGDNGTGKTTIFDAFTWLLFGKDSTGRSDSNFNIKTIDPLTKKPILHLEHSVTGVISVDGKEMKLQRNYVEKWVKPRGTTEETLKNHETEFYLNDVKLATKKEYESEVAAILTEDIFRMITNPFYFISLKVDAQKELLFDMAGGISDDEVAAIKPEYIELLAQLSGRSLSQFSKEVAAKKKACNDVLAVIPSQIDTARRLMPESEDWEALEIELQKKKQRLTEIDNQITDKSKINEQENQRKLEIQRTIGDKRMSLVNRQNEIRASAGAERNEVMMKLKDLEYNHKSETRDLELNRSSLSNCESEIQRIEDTLSVLRNEYRKINAETIQYPEGAFVCPTCKRQLEVDDIEAKQNELLANFNQNKAKRLKENKDKGFSLVELKKKKEAERDSIISKIKESEDRIVLIEREIEVQKANMPEAPDVDAMIKNDPTCISLNNEIADLNNQLNIESKPVDVSELRFAKSSLDDNIQELYKRLAKRDQIERAKKEIEELEEKRIQNNQAKADLEKWEFTVMSFQKDKDAKLIEKINSMFEVVSFSFVTEQLNGGEKLTCVCTVNGTPYPDVNTAGKVNAGLDIINAICKYKGVSAPIFIDNSESVNKIIPTISQVINLVVSKDKLTVN
ncbi:MAG: AAA domain protein [Satomivirus wayo]|jgi:DNA repair exonuclease SbcCD ATPase subunit|uniref:AAA domain protein n=1 Tax=Bacteriophage sp. TaxID=38018 RepID=A0ABY5T2G4_9VIRU|nr:MAG: AAA domain protein [Bacteriophage sp.]UVY14686.1 MAG: AAA domain protein [Bacteriophage sp.]DAE85814.1 MAG TPA: chromosome partition protein [Bacteriophage sp.]